MIALHFFILPWLQGSVQSWYETFTPSHIFPSPIGGGLSHVRVLIVVEFPHTFEHGPHSDQLDHSPSLLELEVSKLDIHGRSSSKEKIIAPSVIIQCSECFSSKAVQMGSNFFLFCLEVSRDLGTGNHTSVVLLKRRFEIEFKVGWPMDFYTASNSKC